MAHSFAFFFNSVSSQYTLIKKKKKNLIIKIKFALFEGMVHLKIIWHQNLRNTHISPKQMLFEEFFAISCMKREFSILFNSPTTVGLFNDYEGHLSYRTAPQHRGHILWLPAVGLVCN